MEKKKYNITYLDRDGKLSINGTFNFEGSLIKLRKIIDDTIEEYGEDTDCKINIFGSFPHKYSTNIIIKNK
jgi:hypothetical protein